MYLMVVYKSVKDDSVVLVTSSTETDAQMSFQYISSVINIA